MSKKQFDVPTLLLVEHGATDFTGEGDEDRLHGTKYDLPLTAEGHRQAARTADKLASHDIGSVKTSPMQRAKETAEYIGESTGQKPEEDEDLKPLDSGYLSGMTHKAAEGRMEYYVKHPEKPIPEGQAYGDWWDRASTRMAKRLKETERIHKDSGQGAVDVLHSSEIACMPAMVKGDGPSCFESEQIPGPGKISAVEKHGGRWTFTPDWRGDA